MRIPSADNRCHVHYFKDLDGMAGFATGTGLKSLSQNRRSGQHPPFLQLPRSMGETASQSTSWPRLVCPRALGALFFLAVLFGVSCFAQEHDHGTSGQPSVPQSPQPKPSPEAERQINVNWLYGAYVPKDVKLVALDGRQRVRLWLHVSFLTYGIYFKTALFSISDQVQDRPPAWGDGWGGYGKRVVSRQGQFVIQNSLSALGNGVVGFEPRYNRCQCDGFWPRTRHAVARNFVTYDRTETKIRPQLPLYAAAFGAGVVAGTWTPNHDLLTTGGRGALSQVEFGVLANVVGEFWPEIERIWKRKKPGSTPKN
jgi:hypothetical protein